MSIIIIKKRLIETLKSKTMEPPGLYNIEKKKQKKNKKKQKGMKTPR